MTVQPEGKPMSFDSAKPHDDDEKSGAEDQEDGYDDDDSKADGSNPRERRKIEIKFILNKARRHITFSKRKHGIMKKAWELSVLTGTQVLLLVVSETGLVYTFTTPKLQPLVTQSEGKNLIQACLNAPEPADGDSPEGSPREDDGAMMPGNGPGPAPIGVPGALGGRINGHSSGPGPASSNGSGPGAMGRQSPSDPIAAMGNLTDPNTAGYAQVLAARKAQEADAQRMMSGGPPMHGSQNGTGTPGSGPPGAPQGISTPGMPNSLHPGVAVVMPGAPGPDSPQPAGQAAGTTGSVPSQVSMPGSLPPHLQHLAAQGYKLAPQYGYQGYPYAAAPLSGQYGQVPGMSPYPGQLDPNALLAIQQQAQQAQQAQTAQASGQGTPGPQSTPGGRPPAAQPRSSQNTDS